MTCESALRFSRCLRLRRELCGVVADVVQIALGDDSKRADRRQHAALGAVDLVDTVALPNGPALASTWEVEILRVLPSSPKVK